ncbi:MAG: TRAP transporter small permease subunit [Azoarcus sp.]|nr:TRAP transporter small permease subunit [Azoarcus sp.]
MGFLLKLSVLIDRANALVGRAVIWLLFAAALISAGNAIARKTLAIGSNAMLEIQWYLFAAAFMLGAAATFLNNGHVRIDVLAGRFPTRVRMFIDIVGIVVFLLPLCWFMIDFSMPIVLRAFTSGEVSSNAGGLIRWPVYALLPAGFLLLALQSVSELIKRVACLKGRIPDPLAAGRNEAAAKVAPIPQNLNDGGDR